MKNQKKKFIFTAHVEKIAEALDIDDISKIVEISKNPISFILEPQKKRSKSRVKRKQHKA